MANGFGLPESTTWTEAGFWKELIKKSWFQVGCVFAIIDALYVTYMLDRIYSPGGFTPELREPFGLSQLPGLFLDIPWTLIVSGNRNSALNTADGDTMTGLFGIIGWFIIGSLVGRWFSSRFARSRGANSASPAATKKGG